MKKYYLYPLLFLILLIFPTATTASDITNADYEATVVVSNNDTAATNVSVPFTLSTPNMVAAGYMDYAATRVAMTDSGDVPFMPGYAANPWVIFVPAIGADATIRDSLYTGPSSLSSTKVYFPTAAGMTLSDNTTYEFGGNFTLEKNGTFLNATAPTSYPTISSNTSGYGTSNSFAVTMPAGLAAGDLIIVIADGYDVGTTGAPAFTAAAGFTTLFHTSYNTIKRFGGWYKVADGTEGVSQTWAIDRNTYYSYKCLRIATGTYIGFPVCGTTATGAASSPDPPNLAPTWGSPKILWLPVAGSMHIATVAPTNYTGLDSSGQNSAFTSFSYRNLAMTSENAGVYTTAATNWAANTIAIENAGLIAIKPNAYQVVVPSDGVIEASIYGGVSVNTTVSSTEYDNLKTYADSNNLTIEINGAIMSTLALGGVNIPDNANNWQFGSLATPYITSVNMTVGGVHISEWHWEYGTTFRGHEHLAPDVIVYSLIDATPSFRTTSSDADVSAVLTTFNPINTADAPTYTVTDQGNFYTGNITASGNFTSANVSPGGPPALNIVEDVSNDSGTPPAFIWGILGSLLFAGCGIGLSYTRKKFSLGGGYVFIIMGLGIAIFGILIAFGKFDWWMLWFYLIIAGGLAMASRHIDWGGATSQHSIIGFLAMCWIGLTLINRILEGTFITASETAFLNTVAFTKAFNLLNLFTIPIMNFSFFTEGIPALLRWDYSFFGGQAQIIQYLLYSITAVVSFIIFGIILGLVYSAITRAT